MIRLRAENEYLRAENEVIKKEIALRAERLRGATQGEKAALVMETFFGRLKNEMFYGFEKQYPSFEALSIAIADYIDYYNNRRIQAKTKWMPPSKFRKASITDV